MILFLLKGKSDDASSRVRVLNYLPFLEQDGIKFRTVSFRYYLEPSFSKKVISKIYRETFHLRVIFNILFYKPKKIYIQKLVINKGLLSFIKKTGSTILLDLDDAIFFKEESHEFSSYLNNINKLIVCSDFYSHLSRDIDTTIIPSCVEKINEPRWKEQSNLICWIGSPYTEKYLLDIKDQLFRFLNENPKLKLELVGTSSSLDMDHPNIIRKRWSVDQENDTLRRAAVGIMPIRHDEWSKYKCAYKLLLYMSNGVLAVGSNWGANSKVIESGRSGILIDTEDKWYDQLNSIVNNFEAYEKVIQGGIERVNANFSYSSNFTKWKETILN